MTRPDAPPPASPPPAVPPAPAAPAPRRPAIEALYHYHTSFDAPDVIARYTRTDRTATPGMVTNFVGAKVPPVVYPPILDGMVGHVEGPPDPGNWHADIAEWAAALWAVDNSQGVFRIIELGCGWGCWLTITGVAARYHGREVALIGIEGDRNHLRNAETTLAANGFEPPAYRLVHGIAAGTPGKAIFPNPAAGTAAWGGAAIYYPSAADLAAAEADPGRQVLECYTLAALSAGAEVDLLHIDIQGAEVDYVRGNLEQMGAYVRRVLIGTHSRAIEGALHEIFLAAGWRLEMERPALVNITPEGRPETGIDGVQLWVNPAPARTPLPGVADT